MIRLFCLASLLSLVAISAAWADDEEKVPLDKLPKAIVDAVKKKFPKAELVEASKETENGKTEYEVSIKDGGKSIDVTLTADGTITGLEKEIDAKDLPKAVIDALESKYPKATYKTVEEVIAVKKGKETLEYYEVELVTADNKTFEVEVTSNGKIKKTEEKKDEKKKDEKK